MARTLSLPALSAELKDVFSERRIRGVMATAITRTAKRMREEWQRDITDKTDRPTLLTQRAVKSTMATAQSLKAVVSAAGKGERGTPSNYLAPMEYGGGRDNTRFEATLQSAGILPRGWYVVPGRGAMRDGYGNVNRSVYIGVLRDLASGAATKGYGQAISRDAGKRAKATAKHGRTYSAVLQGDPSGISPGIYTRHAGKMQAVFVFKQRVTYSKVLSLGQAAEGDVMARIVGEELERAIAENMGRVGR